jgi:hypothetical protein
MNLFGGKKRGLLENSKSLCKGKRNRTAKIRLVGQNGRVKSQDLRIGTSCGGKR